jgi:hypothetical protein
MTWYITKGDDLERGQKIRFPFCRSLLEGFDDSHLMFHSTLYQSENTTAPLHPSKTATKTNCVLISDLTKVDRSHFKRKTGIHGLTYYQISYDLTVTMQPANMKFALEIDGEEMGSVEANYD